MNLSINVAWVVEVGYIYRDFSRLHYWTEIFAASRKAKYEESAGLFTHHPAPFSWLKWWIWRDSNPRPNWQESNGIINRRLWVQGQTRLTDSESATLRQQIKSQLFIWWRRGESNPRPKFTKVEQKTLWLKVRCFTDLNFLSGRSWAYHRPAHYKCAV